MKSDASKKSKWMVKQAKLGQFLFKKKTSQGSSCSTPTDSENPSNASMSPSIDSPQENDMNLVGSSPSTILPLGEEELIYDVELLPHDPGKRISIMDYPPNKRDLVRRGYILKKPCQPRTHYFPQKDIGGSSRIFIASWFDKWDWLEYSIEKDAAFCFVCYLFKNEIEANPGGDAFVKGGFKSWNKPDRFTKHVGGINSVHNLAYEKYVNLRDGKKKSIIVCVDNANYVNEREYEIRLKASISCASYLLRQGLAFRGHRESEESLNRGNFIELLKLLRAHNETISKVTLENAPGNCQLIAPMIQKDVINCCAKETTKRILEELGDDYFAILADESSDVSQKEQLALCLRYVEGKMGKVVERFIGLVHVGDTTALSLKNAIISLLVEHSLSPSKIRGQGYDGASNMKGEINGLKTLIRQDSPSAYYVHCFAHQLQLTLVAIEVIDLLLQELDNRFDEVNMELLRCMACLNPKDCFCSFDKEKVLKLATFYPSEFSSIDLISLECQLDIFMEDMKRDDEFHSLHDVSSLSMKLVETKRHVAYPLVFLLIKLVLILPVATASVERVFYGMTYVKNKLRSSMGDQFLNDCLVTFIEREMFLQVSDDEIANHFQQMKTRRVIN